MVGETDTDAAVIQALEAYMLAASTAMEPGSSEDENNELLQG